MATSASTVVASRRLPVRTAASSVPSNVAVAPVRQPKAHPQHRSARQTARRKTYALAYLPPECALRPPCTR